MLGEILTHLADVEIEFKITSIAELAARPPNMFSYDLVVGHRVLWAGAAAQGLPGCDHHRDSARIPTSEATRLLMNRCSGLLFAHAQLEAEPFTPAAADFVRRNLAKVQLACGDAVLTAHGRYDWSCRTRQTRLAELAAAGPGPWLDAVRHHHTAGVAFKLHPNSGGLARESLRALCAEVTALARDTWLALETRRLGRAFPTVRAYAEDCGDQCPDTSPLHNFALNFRAAGFRFHSRPNPWRHPRQRVFRALALLLWEPAALTDPALRALLETDLHARVATPVEALAAYRALWSRVR